MNLDIRSALSTALFAACLALPWHAFAEPLAEVVKLRTKTVALYDQPNGTKIGEFAQGDFRPPWPVLAVTKEGFLQVDIGGKQRWVRAFAVETNKPIAVKVECDVAMGNGPQSAATRGLGKECK